VNETEQVIAELKAGAAAVSSRDFGRGVAYAVSVIEPTLKPEGPTPMTDLDLRHPSTGALLRWFEFAHLRDGVPREVSRACANLASALVTELTDGPELTAGLRKLLEAKDCFVRQAIAQDTPR
jgi:hypothetical protein